MRFQSLHTCDMRVALYSYRSFVRTNTWWIPSHDRHRSLIRSIPPFHCFWSRRGTRLTHVWPTALGSARVHLHGPARAWPRTDVGRLSRSAYGRPQPTHTLPSPRGSIWSPSKRTVGPLFAPDDLELPRWHEVRLIDLLLGLALLTASVRTLGHLQLLPARLQAVEREQRALPW